MESDFDFCGTIDIDCTLFGYAVKKKKTSCWTPTFIKDMVFTASEEKDELKGELRIFFLVNNRKYS